jgi:hypothetical protein
MIPAPVSTRIFRAPSKSGLAADSPTTRNWPKPDDLGRGPIIVCRACQARLTTPEARITIGGAHEHSYENPHGIRFRIGCFAWVGHCAAVTPPSTYWSWFPGFAWRVAVCTECGEHLGWLFQSADATFHGLILDRLSEVTENHD